MEVQPGMRIGVLYDEGIHIISVGNIGYARGNLAETPEYAAVAKISPGQPAINWDSRGYVHLMKLQYLVSLEPQPDGMYRFLRIWEPIKRLPVVPVTREEKRAIWTETPLEKLVDDNTSLVTPKNEWFYRR